MQLRPSLCRTLTHEPHPSSLCDPLQLHRSRAPLVLAASHSAHSNLHHSFDRTSSIPSRSSRLPLPFLFEVNLPILLRASFNLAPSRAILQARLTIKLTRSRVPSVLCPLPHSQAASILTHTRIHSFTFESIHILIPTSIIRIFGNFPLSPPQAASTSSPSRIYPLLHLGSRPFSIPTSRACHVKFHPHNFKSPYVFHSCIHTLSIASSILIRLICMQTLALTSLTTSAGTLQYSGVTVFAEDTDLRKIFVFLTVPNGPWRWIGYGMLPICEPLVKLGLIADFASQDLHECSCSDRTSVETC